MTADIEAPLSIAPSAPHPGHNRGLRTGLIALAEYLTDQDTYADPWDLFHAFLPWVKDRKTIENWASDLLRAVVARHAGTGSDFDIELALDYLTGVR